MTVQKLTLDRQLEELLLPIAVQQDALDAAWQDDLCEFLSAWRVADRAGRLAAVGRALAPARLMMTEATIDVKLFVSHGEATGWSVRLVALGLQKRYEHTTQAHLELRCTLTSRPPAPREASAGS
jgi:hypothetical protein